MNAHTSSAIALLVFVGGAVDAQRSKPPAPAPPIVRAQQIVDDFVKAHPELVALELALTSAQGCKTVAATAREDIGEKCDQDELGPIKTGQPDVEEPTKADPVYDITQALHDATGAVIGAAGMDLKPAVGNRDAALKRAADLLRELEAAIPSKSALIEPVRR